MSRLMHDKNGKILGVFDRRFVPLAEIQPGVSDHDIAVLIKAFTSLTDPHSLWAKEDPDYIPAIREQFRSALQEGAEVKKTVTDFLAMARTREDEFTLGTSRWKFLHTDDLAQWRKQFFADTYVNQRRWQRRFESGLSKHRCPECGFAGQGFVDTSKGAFGQELLVCPNCYLRETPDIFTRAWATNEWDTRQEKIRKEWAAQDKVRQEQNRVKQERRNLIESRATEIRRRCGPIFSPEELSMLGMTPIGYGCCKPENDEYFTEEGSLRVASRLEFTVDELVLLWDVVGGHIYGMEKRGELDDDILENFESEIISQAFHDTPEESLRQLLARNAKSAEAP